MNAGCLGTFILLGLLPKRGDLLLFSRYGCTDLGHLRRIACSGFLCLQGSDLLYIYVDIVFDIDTSWWRCRGWYGSS